LAAFIGAGQHGMELIDTHCHLDWKAFDPDREAVIHRAVRAGVRRMITIGVDVPSSRRAIEIAATHDAVYAAVGVHPNDCAGFDATLLNDIRSLAQHPKVVAIGEVGLDYYWHKVDYETQVRAFRAQLALAAELNKPVIVHSRDAASES
jgi:TatD DNase family protein